MALTYSHALPVLNRDRWLTSARAAFSTDIDDQYILARQLILAVLVMGVVELIYSTNSLFFLRKQVHDTFVEARECFDEIFQTHLVRVLLSSAFGR